MAVLGVFILGLNLSIAQDTTWQQTFTYNDITKRRGVYEMPDGSQDFRKVLMYYNLKCDAQTTQDNFACGEWDYLTYTNLFIPTGELDSTAINHPKIKSGNYAPDTLWYVSDQGYDYYQGDLTQTTVNSSSNVLSAIVGAGADDVDFVFKNDGGNGRSQFVYLKEELAAAGLLAGDIDVIRFNKTGGGSDIGRLTVRMKTTSADEIEAFEEGMDIYYDFPQTNLTNGWNELALNTPFVWNGNTNILVEFAYEGGDGTSLTLAGDEAFSLAGRFIDGSNKAFDFSENDYFHVFHENGFDINEEITVQFWMFGSENQPQRGSTFEALNAAGGRTLNSHTPWDNGNVYWDAGNDGGSDRIEKSQTEDKYMGQWNHYAFTKNAVSGAMKVYINGNPRISGNGKNKTMQDIVELYIGSAVTYGNGPGYDGLMDEFAIFNKELTRTEIQDNMFVPISASHPQYNALLHYYDFEEGSGSVLLDQKGNKNGDLFGSENWVELKGTQRILNQVSTSSRPQLEFLTGDFVTSTSTQTWKDSLAFPLAHVDFFSVDADNRGVSVASTENVFLRTTSKTFDLDGNLISETDLNASMFVNEDLTYYSAPFEVTKTIEIGRFITPYGINLDLGPQGFTWVFDVTEYLPYLTDSVEISAGNQQELIDLKFAFVHGTAPRDLIQMDQVWGSRRSYSYAALDNDDQIQNTTVDLAPQSESWTFRARLTGHGHNSNDGNFPHCCEWKDNSHYLYANGTKIADFKVFRYTECAVNPVFPQGGTWPGAREGWCPGDVVWNYDYELADYVTGNTVELDYDITPVPANNQGMGGGNYQAAFHLFQYGPAKFQNDVELYDVINPNNWEYVSRRANSCSNPKVTIRNNSASPLTSARIQYGVKDGVLETYNWTGNISAWQTAEIDLPIASSDFWKGSGDNVFTVTVDQPNGVADEYADNNSMSTNFVRPDVLPKQIIIEIKTNNIPGDNSYVVKDASGTVILSRGNFAANTTYKDTLELDEGCYNIELTDEGQDGLYYWAYAAQGNGSFRIKNMANGVIKGFEPEFGYKLNYAWQAGESLNVQEASIEANLQVYPNPSNGLIQVRLLDVNPNDRIEVLNALGQVIYTVNDVNSFDVHTIDLENQSAGVYFISLPGTGLTQRVIIE